MEDNFMSFIIVVSHLMLLIYLIEVNGMVWTGVMVSRYYILRCASGHLFFKLLYLYCRFSFSCVVRSF